MRGKKNKKKTPIKRDFPEEEREEHLHVFFYGGDDGSENFNNENDIDDDERIAHEMYHMETEVITSLTTTMNEQSEKVDDGLIQPPIPIERENSCIFPIWLVISVAILALVGIVGGICELVVQFQRPYYYPK